MVYLVVVKGNKHQVALAAAERGIPFAFQKENGYNETLGLVGEEHFRALAKWLSEDTGTAPFPAGTCLWFGAKESDSAKVFA